MEKGKKPDSKTVPPESLKDVSPESLKDVIDDVLDLTPPPAEQERIKEKKELEEFFRGGQSKVFPRNSTKEINEVAPFLLKKSKGQ